MLINTTDFFTFILTLASGHKVSIKKNLLASFSWIEWDGIWYGDEAIQVEHPETSFEWFME